MPNSSYEKNLASELEPKYEKPLISVTAPSDQLVSDLEKDDIKALIQEEIDQKAYYVTEDDLQTKVDEYVEQLQEQRAADIEGIIKAINICMQEDIDTIMFLDKSARPYYYVISKVWDYLEDRLKKDGKILKPKPAIIFRNIGRENKFKNNPYERKAGFSSFREGMRGLGFEQHDEGTTSGKKILIVDDIVNLGKTMHMVNSLMKQAVPEAEIFAVTIKEGDWYSNSPSDKAKRALGVDDFSIEKARKVALSRNEPEMADGQLKAKYQYGFVSIPRNLNPDQQEEVNALRSKYLRKLIDVITENITMHPAGSFYVESIDPAKERLIEDHF